jgi:hypothetical protein
LTNKTAEIWVSAAQWLAVLLFRLYFLSADFTSPPKRERGLIPGYQALKHIALPFELICQFSAKPLVNLITKKFNQNFHCEKMRMP